MRKVRTPLIIAITIGLLAGSAVGIAGRKRLTAGSHGPRIDRADRVETRPGEVDELLIARGIDMLNFVALDPVLAIADLDAYVRRRELPALIAVGSQDPAVL